jgi:hypothetical protein
MKLRSVALLTLLLAPTVPVVADDDAYWLTAETLAGLELRALGPAVASGRIGDLAVDPTDESRIFAAVASGGVWRSVNGGTTWEPVFDS